MVYELQYESNSFETHEAVYIQILKHAKFWSTLKAAQGSMANIVRKTQAFATTEEMLTDLGHAVKNLQLSPRFFQAMYKVVKKRGDEVFKMMAEFHLGTDMSQWEGIFDLADRTFGEMESNGKQLKVLFNHFLSAIDQWAPMGDLNILKQELSGKTNFKESTQLFFKQSFSSQVFWGSLGEFSDIAVALYELQSFRSFIPFCKRKLEAGDLQSYLEENREEVTPSKDEEKSIENSSSTLDLEVLFDEPVAIDGNVMEEKSEIELKYSCKEIATFLREVCLPEYKKKLEEILIDDVDVPVSKILYIFLDVKQIKDEMKRAIRYLRTPPIEKKKVALQNYMMFPSLKNNVTNLEKIIEAFGIKPMDDDPVLIAMKSFNRYSQKQSEDITLYAVSNVVVELQKLFHEMEAGDTWELVTALSQSRTLLTFLKEVADEDVRNLIDASEEHSEQHIQVSTVSDLIQVHRTLYHILAGKDQQCLLNTFFSKICKIANPDNKSRHTPKNLAGKIIGCADNVHNLKALYQNVANRGELTKAIVMNSLNKGSLKLEIDTRIKECLFVLTYKNNKIESAHSMQELFDLRSRALLIANSEKNESKQEVVEDEQVLKQRRVDMKKFVEIIDKATLIADTCTQLHQSGHFNYQKYKKVLPHGKNVTQEKRFDDLESTISILEKDLQYWKKALEDARNKYYVLNFLWGDQLAKLKQCCDQKHLTKEVNSILKYIHPDIDDESLINIYQQTSKSNDLDLALEDIGEALHKVTMPLKPFCREIHDIQTFQNVEMKMKKGELYIAQLDPGSSQLIPVITMLYADTVQRWPEASQLLFCNEDTAWEEVKLLLNRCLHSKRKTGLQELFCIANVELLPNEMQFQLVEQLQKSLRQAEDTYQTDFYLSLICQSGPHDPIIDQFYKHVHRVNALSPASMEKLLKNCWPEVYMVTSDVPGLGKSETIRSNAACKNMSTATLELSGPLTRDKLVQMVNKLKVKRFQVLHIDIGATPNPALLDSFLFELIVIGIVSSETSLVCLPTKNIAVEVANSIQHGLRDSLSFLHCFKQIHLKWGHYEDFIVSKELNDSTQVVCKYLQALDTGRLDEENIFLNQKGAAGPLPEIKCRQLLSKNFDHGQDMSFSVVNVFMNVMADQLKKMSASYYFRVENIEAMLGKKQPQQIRTIMVNALMEISKEFACRSVQSCRSSQTKAVKDDCEAMADRMKGMIQWADSNHLMIVFHGQDAQTVSALYRDVASVPPDVVKLFKSQLQKDLEKYESLNQENLQTKVERVARMNNEEFDRKNLGEMRTSYALTPDNLLKMVLISLRIKASVPVVLMGETGCGKTSLVRYLAATCEVEFFIFNFHAGVTAAKIEEKALEIHERAKNNPKQQFWMFLDEINTCDHLGLLNEIICHHSCKGKALARNLKFVAACNPYRLREETQILTAGLKGKVTSDPLSKLVYRVHPLPEAMTDYVWDYGILSENDENAYIERMMMDVFAKSTYTRGDRVVNALISSQRFLRTVEKTAWSVSLRDVQRCKVLMLWFYQMLKDKMKYALHGYCYPDTEFVVVERAVLLALCHCYYARLPHSDQRKQYMELIAKEMYPSANNEYLANEFSKLLRLEQMDLLNRMKLPSGIAKNTALRENVFVILVCILNKIPVFVVGKPGCSKSLSMQLLKSNLRGQDSHDDFFKTLPQLYVVSYQGSESSTSEGIEKVFAKAEQYLNHNKNENVLPVVLLDEVGLAEVSRFNPLKVLHNLLEPATGKVPNIAVVGISNWALDAAKMNRAIHLSRPDLDVEELVDTAVSIGSEFQNDLSRTQKDEQKKLFTALAKAYFHYQKNQTKKNFHGLRDYYALIKFVTKHMGENEDTEKVQIILKGLQRNFGGIRVGMNDIVKTFEIEVRKEFENSVASFEIEGFDSFNQKAQQLIKDNLADKSARYLMLITSGDSAVGILERNLKDQSHEYEVMMGSQFEEDQTEDYSYRILSRIIICMERGVVLILKDLDHIYGSLYDLLNQNYTQSGNKKNCRVAIGPYSNPVCQVHDDFRCIVLMDEKNVHTADPPFLNRFEKQFLQIKDVVNPWQRKLVDRLYDWSTDFATVEHHHFKREDCFLGFHKDLIPSLVLECSPSNIEDIEETKILRDCKHKLQKLATPDAILRLTCSHLKDSQREDVEDIIRDGYFQRKMQRSVSDCVHNVYEEHGSTEACAGLRLVIYTHSNVHIDIMQELGTEFPAEVKKLSAYKSERQLTKDVKSFWFESQAKFLFLQCKPSLDADHILLAKYQIESCASKYMLENGQDKNIVFIIHIDRHEKEIQATWQFNYLSGWQLVTVDMLESSPYPFVAILERSMLDILDSSILPLQKVVKSQILWAFTCIKYNNAVATHNVKEILEKIEAIADSEAIVSCLTAAVRVQMEQMQEMTEKGEMGPDSWQVKVACNTQALGNASTFWKALLHSVRESVKTPLAKLVYALEKHYVWHSFLQAEDEDTRLLWQKWVLDPRITDTDRILDPDGAECYEINDLTQPDLGFPFVKHFEGKLASVKKIFMEDVSEMKKQPEYLDDTGMLSSDHLCRQITKYKEFFCDKAQVLLEEQYFKTHIERYLEDLIWLTCKTTKATMEKEVIVNLVKWILEDRVAISNIDIQLDKFILYHIALWYFEPMIQQVLQMLDVCMENLPSAKDVLRNFVVKNFEEILVTNAKKRLQQIDEKESTMTADGMDQTAEPENEDENITSEKELNGTEKNELGSTENVSEFDPLADNEAKKLPASIETASLTDVQMQDQLSSESSNDENDLDVNKSSDRGATSVVIEPNVEGSEKEEKICNIKEINKDKDIDVKLANEETEEQSDEDIENPVDDISENVQDNNEQECGIVLKSEELLVDFLCHLMYPTKDVLQQCGGVRDWQSKISILQSFASRVSSYPTGIHFLSLCSDFAASIILPFGVNEERLVNLGKIGIDLGDEVMSSIELLEFLHGEMIELVTVDKVPKAIGQQYLCMSMGRLLDLDPENPLLPNIVQLAITGNMPDPNLSYFGTVLQKLLWGVGEDAELLSTLCEIIISENEEAYYPQFKYINEELQQTDGNGQRFMILLVNILETGGFESLPSTFIDDIGCEKTELEILQMASTLIRSSKHMSFRVLVAIAYSKKILQNVSAQIKKTHKDKQIILSELDHALGTSEEYEDSDQNLVLRDYFLKCQKAKHTLAKTKKEISGIAPIIKCINSIDWPGDEVVLGLGLNPLIKAGHLQELSDIWQNYLTDKKEDEVKEFLHKAISSHDYTMALFCFMFQHFTLVQIVRPLKDTERASRQILMKGIKKFTPANRALAEKLLLHSDFELEWMQLTEETSFQSLQQASVLYHLMILILANNPTNEKGELPVNAPIFAKCILAPHVAREAYLPGCSDQVKTNTCDTYSAGESVSFHICKNGTVIGQQKDTQKHCEVCLESSHEQTIDVPETKKDVNVADQDQIPGYHPSLENEDLWSYCTGQMSPLPYRLMRMLVHGCFLLAQALGYLEPENEDTHHPLTSQMLTAQYKKDWKALTEMLDETDEGVCRFVHLVIENMSDHIAREPFSCSKPEIMQEYENSFQSHIEILVEDRRYKMQEWFTEVCNLSGYRPDSVECVVNEVAVGKEPTLFQVLFCNTGRLSMDSLKHNFMSNNKTEELKFLGYFLAHERELSLMKYLWPLMRWHREVHDNLHRRLSKEDFYDFTIAKFINSSEFDKEQRQDIYDKFEEAWNELKKIANMTLLGFEDEQREGFIRMNRGEKLSHCLVQDDTSPLLLFIKALQEIQNDCILRAMGISLSSEVTAVSFMRRSESCVSVDSIQIQDALEGDLISYEWNEKLLHFSQFNTNYGQGQEVVYDFQKIEKELAKSILPGRSYLSSEIRFPVFVYAGQFFHAYSTILYDLSNKIPQERLQPNIRDSLNRKKEEDPNYVSELLTQLEIIIPYMKRTGGSPKTPIVKYTEDWLSKSAAPTLQTLLPGTVGELQLSHIVHLYEFTEELMAENAIEALDEKFKEPLPPDSMSDFIQSEVVALVDLKTAIARLVIRYVSSNQAKVEKGKRMSDLICIPSLWSDSVDQNGILTKILGEKQKTLKEVFPDDLTMAHICEAYQDAKKQLEARNKRRGAQIAWTSNRTQRIGTNQGGRTRQRSRKSLIA